MQFINKMLYAFQTTNKPFGVEDGPSTSSSPLSGLKKQNVPQEDEVDLQLYQMSGNIQRERDDKL